MVSEHWIIITILSPLIGAILAFLMSDNPARYAISIVVSLFTSFCAFMLLFTVWTQGPIDYVLGGWERTLAIRLYADGLSVILVLMTVFVSTIIAVYAIYYFDPFGEKRGDHNNRMNKCISYHPRRYFWPLWFLCQTSLVGIFLSADLFNLYIMLEILGLSGVALVASAGSAALTASMRYLFVTLTGSLFYLAGVALLYAISGSLDVYTIGSSLSASLNTYTAVAFIAVGLSLKTALFPLHFWLPSAHANAPSPVSALLSSLVIKTTFYLIMRLWIVAFDDLILTPVGVLFGALGSLAILWGSFQALRQRRLKMLIAYSTVAQIGYLFLLFPLLKTDDWAIWYGITYFIVCHAVAKASLFLAAGNIIHAIGHDRIDKFASLGNRMPITFLAFGMSSVSLLGLPPGGGYLAKWLIIEAAVVSNHWPIITIIIIGGLLAAGYAFKVIQKAFSPSSSPSPETFTQPPAGMEWTCFALAATSVILGLTSYYPFQLMDIGIPFGTEMGIRGGAP